MKKLVPFTIAIIIRPVSNFIYRIRKWLNTEITKGLFIECMVTLLLVKKA